LREAEGPEEDIVIVVVVVVVVVVLVACFPFRVRVIYKYLVR
jgi:hypothetical protein